MTVDGVRHRLPDPFVLVATQNPVEQHGTYPLPEGQLDRFAVRIVLGPSPRTSSGRSCASSSRATAPSA